jgi:hypothetical protein
LFCKKQIRFHLNGHTLNETNSVKQSLTSELRGTIPPLPQYAFMASCPVEAQGQLYLCFGIKSRDGSVGIALGYRLDDRGSRVRFPAEAGNFSLHHRVQNGSGAHPASYPMDNWGSFLGGKAAGAWSWPLTSIQCRGQRIRGAIPPVPKYVFMAWCLVEHRDNFTFHSYK